MIYTKSKTMKKLLFIISIAIIFTSCQKGEVINPNAVTTWVAGSWKRTSIVDTVFTGTAIAGINNLPVNLNANVITFDTNTTGSSPVYGSFTYSLTALTFVTTAYGTYNIKPISSTSFELYRRANGVGYGDYYTKQ